MYAEVKKMRVFSASGSLTSVLLELPSRKDHELQNMISKKVHCLDVKFQYSVSNSVVHCLNPSP